MLDALPASFMRRRTRQSRNRDELIAALDTSECRRVRAHELKPNLIVLDDQPDHPQRRPPQRIRVLAPRRLLVDRPEADQRVDLVGQRHGDAHRIGRHAIGRALRLVVLLARGGDGGVLALRQRVVLAHQALQLGEFADHFGQQIGLAQLRRALGLLDIGADQRRDLGGEALDARDALGLGAELLVEHDLIEFRQPVFRASSSDRSRRRTSRRDSRARITRSLPAMIASPPSLASMLAVRMNLLAQLAGRGIATTKHFWLLRMVARITSPGIDRNSLSNEPISTTGHSTRPDDLVEQHLILDQFEVLRERQRLGVGEDDVLAALRIEHDLGGVQLRLVILEAAHAESSPAP